MRFPEKLRDAREKAHISQTDLSTQVGVSRRSIFAYENGDSVPRKNILRKLAQALNVTVAYLTDDDSNDPDQGRAREENINMVRERFGSKGAMEAAELLDRNSAFFAGGEMWRHRFFVYVAHQLFLRVGEVCDALYVIGVAGNPLAVTQFGAAQGCLVVTCVNSQIAPLFYEQGSDESFSDIGSRGCYEISVLHIVAISFAARSSSSCVCVAIRLARSRALPLATVG